MNRKPTISGYTTTYNCIEMHYPFRECIESLLGFCDEVCVVDAGSSDGTIEELIKIQKANSRFKFQVHPVDFRHPRWAIHQDGFLKAKARALCSAEYCWQTDTDEIVDERDYPKMPLLPTIMGHTPGIMLPMIEFWGGLDRMRIDFFPWKPRFTINDKRITHGIPKALREYDESGHPYPRPFFSDSCNYIYRDSEEDIQIGTPLPVGCKPLNQMNGDEYANFLRQCIEQLPSVLHVSWLDLPRKINHYKKFWKKFHASMYLLDVADTAENNVMFDKPWSAVTDHDIALKAEQLKQIGPRSFHSKIDPTKFGATLEYSRPIPERLLRWVASERAAGSQQRDTSAIQLLM